MPQPLITTTFDDWIRAVALVAALTVIGYLAVFGSAQIAPLAAGALIGLLGNATSFLFRSKLAVTTTPTDTTVTPSAVARPVVLGPPTGA